MQFAFSHMFKNNQKNYTTYNQNNQYRFKAFLRKIQ